MKIRQGFVSNSSSTSFCIYGCYMVREEFQKILHNFSCVDEIDIEDKDFFIEDVDFGSIINEINKKSNNFLEFYFDQECFDCFYIGAPFENMKEGETLKQFKSKVENAIKDIIKEDVNCEILNATVST